MSKHRKMSRGSKKFAAVGASTATAAALTVGFVSAPEKATTWGEVLLSAATGPDYTQLITDWSNTLDNVLIAQGNIQGGAAAFWNPIASAAGGLLPTFNAGTTQNDLATIAGIISALTEALNNATDLSVVPGLPADTATTVLAGLLQGLVPVPGIGAALEGAAGPLLETLAVLSVVGGVLGQLEAINDLLAQNGLDLIGNLPSLTDLLGLTATQTTYASAYEWPIFGMNGQTDVGNTFVNLPELNLSDLVDNVGDVLGEIVIPPINLGDILGLPGIPGLPPIGLGSPLSSLVGTLLTGLSGQLAGLDGLVATPSVTAWVPAASGAYYFPLGASFGWLAAMPTLALGPIPALSLIDLPDELGIDPNTDTVVMIPISAMAGQLPLGLASFGSVNAGLVFPTATGVSTLGGTTLQTFSMPILGVGYSSLNVGQASYVGTNGFNFNSGTTAGALITPLGPIPLVYSLGSVNAGTTGFGFTGPSLFTVGLLPPIQIGKAPTNQTPDGLIPAALLNTGLGIPTQTVALSSLLGLPDPQSALDATVNPVFNATVAPVGQQLTAALNEINGPLTNGLASGFENFTGAIADATGGPQEGPAVLAATDQSNAKVANTLVDADNFTNASAKLNDNVKQANTRIASAVKNSRAQTDAAVKRAQAQINKIAADGQKAIKHTVDGVNKAVKDTVKKVNGAADNVTKPKKKDAADDK